MIEPPPMTVSRNRPLSVIHGGKEMRAIVASAKQAGETVGIVPTMGALHQGHLSLVDVAASQCDRVVVTIFVNPTQFGPSEDFSRYPRPLERDLELLRGRGCDWAFVPEAEEVYPCGFDTSIDVGAVARPWEGAARPGHFRGVATVVYRLFELAPADKAFFGQKDYQQTLVVKRMVADLGVPIEICVEPIIRDADGLALSSRNAYLSPDDRRRALALSGALAAADKSFSEGERDATRLRQQVRDHITRAGVDLEYVAIVRDGTVEEVDTVDRSTVIAVAARVGTTRLIDNIRLGD